MCLYLFGAAECRTEQKNARAHANWCRVRAQSTKSGRRDFSAWYFVKVFSTINRDLGSSRGTHRTSAHLWKCVHSDTKREILYTIFFSVSSTSLLSVETKSPPIGSCVLPRDCHRSDDRRLWKWDANCDMWMKENHWIKSVDVTATARMLEAINLCLSITHFELLPLPPAVQTHTISLTVLEYYFVWFSWQYHGALPNSQNQTIKHVRRARQWLIDRVIGRSIVGINASDLRTIWWIIIW